MIIAFSNSSRLVQTTSKKNLLGFFMSFPNIVFVTTTRRALGQFALNCQFIVQLKIVLRVQVPTSIYISNVSFGQCLGKTRLLASDNTLDPGTQAGEHACELVWSSLEDSPFNDIIVFFPPWTSLLKKKHSVFSSDVRSWHFCH